jgi:hypothetical protein
VKCAYTILVRKLKEKIPFEGIRADGGMILK